MNSRCFQCPLKIRNAHLQQENDFLKSTRLYKKLLNVEKTAQDRLNDKRSINSRLKAEKEAHSETKKELKHQKEKAAECAKTIRNLENELLQERKQRQEAEENCDAANYVITQYIDIYGPLPEMEEIKEKSDSHKPETPAQSEENNPAQESEAANKPALADRIKDLTRDELETLALKQDKQLNRNSRNSSKPSSTDGFCKQTTNNRTPSGKKPGKQEGSKGYRLSLIKNCQHAFVIPIPDPEEFKDESLYALLEGEFVTKQQVDLKVIPVVEEYRAQLYLDKKTGKKVCAKFPEGMVNEVTYGPVIKPLRASSIR